MYHSSLLVFIIAYPSFLCYNRAHRKDDLMNFIKTHINEMGYAGMGILRLSLLQNIL